jgi:serine kinase
MFVVKKLKVDYIKFDTSGKDIYKKLKKNLLNEYIISKILSHKNIMKILSIDLLHYCLVYEYNESVDFLDYLNTEKFSQKKSIKYFYQLIDAVNYMHDCGIAHMDIKLENILINFMDNQIKLIDFGHSCFFKEGPQLLYSKSFKGTEQYIPPELWKNIAYNPEKVDVWCCGIILYNCVYNAMPWLSSKWDDSYYILFEKQIYNDILHPKIFNTLTFSELNKNDVLLIKKLFLKMLYPNKNIRCNIKYVKNLLMDITLD